MEKNELHVDFSHKLKKIMPIHMVKFKIIIPKLICIDRRMIQELGTIFSKFLKTLLPLNF